MFWEMAIRKLECLCIKLNRRYLEYTDAHIGVNKRLESKRYTGELCSFCFMNKTTKDVGGKK